MRVVKQEVGNRGVPNKYTRWYASLEGSEYLYAEWCAMFLAWSAEQAHVRSLTGTFAYTPTWAEWFAKKGRWGTTPKRGAIVFFDWAGGKSRAGIDHVGIVETVHRDGSVTTIEGNASNRVQRRERSFGIVGYGYWA